MSTLFNYVECQNKVNRLQWICGISELLSYDWSLNDIQWNNSKPDTTGTWVIRASCMGMRLGPCIFVRHACLCFGSPAKGVGLYNYSVGVANVSVEPFSSTASAQLGMDYCPIYGVAGCPLLRGFRCFEKRSGLSEFSVIYIYILGVRRWGGCPLSGIPLHVYSFHVHVHSWLHQKHADESWAPSAMAEWKYATLRAKLYSCGSTVPAQNCDTRTCLIWLIQYLRIITESVDSLCRDGTDTPYCNLC